jgi:GNAT superfamily N-acetyltransferase
MYELIGYAASVLVAISLMMSSILRLRLINLAGAALFAAYGFLIGSTPVAAVNVFIVGINLYYLVRIFGAREYFHILEVQPDSEYLRHFLDFCRADIARFLPDFDGSPGGSDLIFFTLRDVVPAGLVIGEPQPDGTLLVRLDYVLPRFRDFKVGEFVYGQRAAFFRERGIRRLVARALTTEHARYLTRMGFRRASTDEDTRYTRDIG